ncbi:hypothetical protein [Candidatus Accumulibacter contiguus]|jgi:hypothetical protein|uniref:hypothetical protein n=1 Tax=Candidatus Accumulibacter contiguus TaxID=2954381 RepID=UPI002FC33DA7
MERLYDQALANMERTVHGLAQRVSPPQSVPYKDSFVFRYVERTLHQALVQKLARILTGLRAARLLLENGLLQEQGALQRILDELHEDVSFLALAVIYDDHTPLHQAYLDAFYEEEFDAETALESTQKRPMISRQKIRAYIARIEGAALDPSRRVELTRTISKAYSGFIHAASPHVMDMYGGNPPRFHVQGMKGTERQQEHREDLWNYFYRSIVAFALTAKAFGDDALFAQIQQFSREFERQRGKDYAPKP